MAIRLFARSTRSLRLTPEGEVWLPYARQMLDVMHAGLQKFRPQKMKFLARCKSPCLPILAVTCFCRSFSRFDVAIPRCACGFFSDQVTDVFKDPVDVAFRYGNTEDASYIALPVAPSNRRVLVASPEWVAQNGAPQTPDDLTQLNAMTFVLRGRLHDRWTFTRNGEVSSVQVNGTIMSDDAEVIRRLAIAGEGVAYKSWLDVSEDVRDGRLQLLMPDYQGRKSR